MFLYLIHRCDSSFNNNPKSFFILPEIVYEETLKSVQTSFPQYIRELEGVADGAQVEFYKVSP